MTSSTRTKDEKFIVCLYETAMEANDPYSNCNRYTIGEKIHLHPKGVNAICKLLVQANFIKKASEEEIYLTKNGENLALSLLSGE